MINPALPAEQPQAGSGPPSTIVTETPRRASSSAVHAPIAPQPTTTTSGFTAGTVL